MSEHTIVNPVFSASEKMQLEYCASVVRLGPVTPVPDSDHLGMTEVEGQPIVVDRFSTKEGDVMVYCMNETMLNLKFLAVNNQFDISERVQNANAKEVCALYDEDGSDEAKAKAKAMCGFFNKHGRVKMVKLRGQYSMGFLTSLESIVKWHPEITPDVLEDATARAPFNFDTVCGELFLKVYMPPLPENRHHGGSGPVKGRPRFKQYIDGTVPFHYHTDPLNKSMSDIYPDQDIVVTPKLHGTSAIYGNVRIRRHMPKTIISRICQRRLKKHAWRNDREKEFLLSKARRSAECYGYIACSRKIVLNAHEGANVRGEYGWILDNLIKACRLPEDTVVYGEITGYKPGATSMIQKGYAYGSKTGRCTFWPYRIVTPEGEWTMDRVVRQAAEWRKALPEDKRDLIGVLPVLYKGKAGDMYPEWKPAAGENALLEWRDHFLHAVMNDKDRLGMELKEPLNGGKEYREGVVFRVGDKKIAYKQKCLNFSAAEGKRVDKGEIDYEMEEGYAEA